VSSNPRRIIITGAASGIGAALGRRLAAPGTSLFLHTRANEAGLQQVAAQASAAGSAIWPNRIARPSLLKPLTRPLAVSTDW
jgi:3-oxoacyl-[acyl-carrier protein] reductase